MTEECAPKCAQAQVAGTRTVGSAGRRGRAVAMAGELWPLPPWPCRGRGVDNQIPQTG